MNRQEKTNTKLEELFRRAVSCHNAGQLDEAERCYRQILTFSPNDTAALYHLGLVLHAEENRREAVHYYRAALKTEPKNAAINFSLGSALQEIGLPDEAANHFSKTLALEPANSTAHYNLGVILFQQGKPEEAVACYRRALETCSDNTDAHFNLGVALQELGLLAEAADSFQAVLTANPLDTDALYYLGLVFKDIGQLDDAEKCFQYVLALDSDHRKAHSSLGMVYYLLGEFDKAVIAYRQAIDAGDDPETNKHMLAALTGQQTETAPQKYIADLFNNYSATFDSSLRGIGYRIPALLKEALTGLPDCPARFVNAVDLGCGTGLSGLPFRTMSERLHGVDLAEKMLEKARERGIYETLAQSDILEFLRTGEEQFDLFILTDVFVYIGKLDPLFTAMGNRALPDARLLFSTEGCKDDKQFILQPTGRYAHSRRYITNLAVKNGFTISDVRPVGIRKEKEKWIKGDMYILTYSLPA